MRRNCSTAKWLFTSVYFWHSVAIAAVWTIDPGLELQGIYTDNVFLAASGLEETDVIAGIAPTLGINGQGAKSEFGLDYRLEKYFYSENSSQDSTHHQLQTTFHREFVDDILFFDLEGALTQQIIDPLQSSSASNAYVTGNQTDALGIIISPYLNTLHSDGSELLLRPTLGINKYDEVENSNNKRYQYELLYKQSRPEDNHGWLIKFDSTQVVYDNGDKSDLGSVNLEGHVKMYQRMNLIAGIGYEDNEYAQATGGGEIDGSNWTVGVSWRPNRRTLVDARVGERYFGSTGSFNLSRSARHSQWGLSYEETVDAGGQVSATIVPTPIGQRVADAEVSIIERTSANYSYDRAKSRIVLNISKTDRALQLSGNSEESLNAQFFYLYRWSGRNSAELSYTNVINEYSVVSRKDEDSVVSLSFNHNLGRTISGTMLLQRSQRKSDLTSDSYSSNMASIIITALF